MCLILLAIDQHPDFRLIIAANRDEFHARPSCPLDWWADDPQVLAGRDLEGGGSWFGLNRSGDLAAVTNYREAGANQPQRPSRGRLVREYIQQQHTDWNTWLVQNAQAYNGFNLLFGPWDKLCWYSNRSPAIVPLGPGLYGLCNSLLDTPWPKVERGKALLREIVARKSVDTKDLLALMQDDRPAPRAELPDTGIGTAWEMRLSSMFIRSASYGTRSTTALLVNRDHQVQLIERNWTAEGDSTDRDFTFTLNRRG